MFQIRELGAERARELQDRLRGIRREMPFDRVTVNAFYGEFMEHAKELDYLNIRYTCEGWHDRIGDDEYEELSQPHVDAIRELMEPVGVFVKTLVEAVDDFDVDDPTLVLSYQHKTPRHGGLFRVRQILACTSSGWATVNWELEAERLRGVLLDLAWAETAPLDEFLNAPHYRCELQKRRERINSTVTE